MPAPSSCASCLSCIKQVCPFSSSLTLTHSLAPGLMLEICENSLLRWFSIP